MKNTFVIFACLIVTCCGTLTASIPASSAKPATPIDQWNIITPATKFKICALKALAYERKQKIAEQKETIEKLQERVNFLNLSNKNLIKQLIISSDQDEVDYGY